MTDDTTNTDQSRVAADCPNKRLVMRPQCKTKGMIKPGAMCGSVLVGGKGCSKPLGECEHQACPQCGSWEGLKFPRGRAAYCEDCGWPDEDFGA